MANPTKKQLAAAAAFVKAARRLVAAVQPTDDELRAYESAIYDVGTDDDISAAAASLNAIDERIAAKEGLRG